MPWNSHITDAFINLSIQQSIPLIKVCWSLCSEIFGGKYFSIVPAFVHLNYVKWSMQFNMVCQYSVDATLAFYVVVVQLLCLTLCFPRDWSISGFPVHHYLLQFAQTQVHCFGGTILPYHPLSPHFSSCPQSFPASGSFPMSWLFASGGQSIGASASVLPMNI